MNLLNRKAMVVGMGRTGSEAARFLRQRGARVTVSDRVPENRAPDSAQDLRDMGVRLEFGGHNLNSFTQADLIVISPGVPHTLPAVQAAAANGIPVLGEVELASRFVGEPIVAVSGTNGKTTTTRLIGDMLSRSGFKVFLGGNIGTPLVSYLLADESVDWVVLEISSFQLDTITTFRPKVSLLLNISDDHLDRYDDFEAYARAKGRLLKNQGYRDIAVLNGHDPWIRRVSQDAPVRKYYFTGRGQTEGGADITPDGIRLRGIDLRDGGRWLRSKTDTASTNHRAVISLADSPTACPHERENIAAASLATLICGGTVRGVHEALKNFKNLPHRLELAAIVAGVVFYNDSKATNVDAVRRALACLPEPIHLIMCGRDKGGDFERLTGIVRQKVKSLTLWGEAAATIAAALRESAPTRIVANMEDAVANAVKSAVSGDVVLLSPGCTSFDHYRDYKERGLAFCKAVARGNFG